MKFLLLGLILSFSLFFFPQSVQAQDSIQLNVIVLYDSGVSEELSGVGFGRVVLIRESGSTQQYFSFTDQYSSAQFYVQPGTYYVEAIVPQTNLFFTWVCEDSVFVEDPVEYLILHCVEKFFVRLPWARS